MLILLAAPAPANGPGIAFLGASFGIACGLAALAPAVDDDPFLIAWAVALGFLDLFYRSVFVRQKIEKATGDRLGTALSSDTSLLWPLSGLGGSLLFLPAWVFAIVFPLFYFFVVRS